jgi:hypothetical protein
MWLRDTEARLKWNLASVPEDAEPEARSPAQAETQQIGGAALTEGLFTNPLLRAVLIPLVAPAFSEPWTISESCFRFREPTNCYLMRGSTTARAFL